MENNLNENARAVVATTIKMLISAQTKIIKAVVDITEASEVISAAAERLSLENLSETK